jgi:hypothetical protein
MSDELLDTVRKIYGLLELLAEDKIAERDAKQRSQLLAIAGAGKLKQAAILLMDGSRTQKNIVAESAISQGNLSGLVSELSAAELLGEDRKLPKLAISIPANFFEVNSDAK